MVVWLLERRERNQQIKCRNWKRIKNILENKTRTPIPFTSDKVAICVGGNTEWEMKSRTQQIKKHMISIHIKKIYNKNHNNNGKMRSHTNTHITSHLWKKCSCQTEKACLVYSVYKFHAKIRATRNLIPGKFFSRSLFLSLHLSPWKYVNVHQIAWQLQKCRPYFPVSLFHFDCFIIMIWLS